MLTTVLLAAALAVGAVAAARNHCRALFGILVAVAALQLALYFHILSPRTLARSGSQKRAFCRRVLQRIHSPQALQFCDVKDSILFHLGVNVRPLHRREILPFFRSTPRPCLITTKTVYDSLRKAPDVHFVILERTGYLLRDRREYLLLGKKGCLHGAGPLPSAERAVAPSAGPAAWKARSLPVQGSTNAGHVRTFLCRNLRHSANQPTPKLLRREGQGSCH